MPVIRLAHELAQHAHHRPEQGPEHRLDEAHRETTGRPGGEAGHRLRDERQFRHRLLLHECAWPGLGGEFGAKVREGLEKSREGRRERLRHRREFGSEGRGDLGD